MRRPISLKTQLVAIIGNYDALLVRSGTEVTAKVIEAGKSLKFIGRAGAGVDNIDMDAATRKGIIVANAPEGNTLAATEHTMAMMLSLARNIPQANASLRAKEWKRSKFMGVELNEKTLGNRGSRAGSGGKYQRERPHLVCTSSVTTHSSARIRLPRWV